MVRFGFIFLVLAGLLCLGCYENAGDNGIAGGLLGKDIQTKTTIAEIDAVGTLDFERSRFESYQAIARRDGLSSASQERLIKEVMKNLAIETAQVEVLLSLIKNPAFTYEAKNLILENLGRFESQKNTEKIISALSDRGKGIETGIEPAAGELQSLLD